MTTSPHISPRRSTLSRLVLAAVALSLFAVACGSSGETLEAASAGDPIETNEGGVAVRPPDVLEGEEAPAAADIPPPVEGLNDTPVVDLLYFDGTQGSTADFAGRPTVVNFWASNCAPCIAEMPEFEEVFQELGAEVDFVGVNTNDVSRESAERLAEQTGVTYPLVEDVDRSIFVSFGGFAQPTTVLLNPQGQVAFNWTGVLTKDELIRLINEHILVTE